GGGKIEPKILTQRLVTPHPERLAYVQYALRQGHTVKQLAKMTSMDPWFLYQLKEINDMQLELEKHPIESIPTEVLRESKRMGFSDGRLANVWRLEGQEKVRHLRKKHGVLPVYKRVDTCAAEFEAYTPYYYSTYEAPIQYFTAESAESAEKRQKTNASASSALSAFSAVNYDDETVPASGKDRIMILGGGPNRIGQGIEFDYCCCQAAFALKEAGYETIMVNSNPETVSTDYDTSDHLFFEPLTAEDVLNICDRMQPAGLIVQFGGQTPLNLARALADAGAPIIGTSVDSIDEAEDRKLFQELVDRLQLKQPANGTVRDLQQAIHVARRIGYPVLVRPSFVLGGRGMQIVYDEVGLTRYAEQAIDLSQGKPLLIDKFLESAVEVDVDCISDGTRTVIGGVMQHIEEAGIHSGDSACVIPPHSLPPAVVAEIRRQTRELARELKVKGLMNVQFAVTGLANTLASGGRQPPDWSPNQGADAPRSPTIYVLEVNPRASRTAPFVSKATGVPLARLASLVMVGKTLDELGLFDDPTPTHFSVKESVFPFNKFPGVDILLGPEMRSTGEVMGIDDGFPMAFAKSQMAANSALPLSGLIFISVADRDKPEAAAIGQALTEMGYRIVSTRGTAAALRSAGVAVQEVPKIQEGRPNLLDRMKNDEIALVINTPSGKGTRTDESKIRAAAVANGVTCITTIAAAHAAVEA
ncbi:MAG TPA: carbamoyl-phosphate synthase large subunit, partial [Gemmataceae bacterium]|nr:carbamoyl-phosphate synthase large subunit [Gemmataceae bacterium]